MIKDELRANEPKVYQILGSALKNDKVSHLYLLAGPKNPLKLDTAFLLAQSIIEDKRDWACEVCETCQRVKNGLYFDMVYIDGQDEKIHKGDIDDIFKRFEKTALEISGKQVYIINGIENVTGDKVSNMILKYIEEPHDDLYAILVSDSLESVLVTIRSRAQVLMFKKPDNKYRHDHLLKEGLSELDAYLISELDEDVDVSNEGYALAKAIVSDTIDTLSDPGYIEIMYQKKIYGPLKGKGDILKDFTYYYLRLLSIYLNEAMQSVSPLHTEKLKGYDLAGLLEVVLDILSKSDYNYDKRLLLDELAYKMVCVIKGER